jgi:formylmethanofuran:tetrahydromethanopterin formyltransferase
MTGSAIVEAVRNDNINDTNPHFIVGSLKKEENSEVPNGVFKVIDVIIKNIIKKKKI